MGRISLPDHFAEALLTEALDPLIGLFGMTRDAVEEGPEKLGRAETHIFECLVDEQFIASRGVNGPYARMWQAPPHPGVGSCDGHIFRNSGP